MKHRTWLIALLILISCVVLASADTGKVIIPASTTTIEEEAFCGASSVTTVEIPDSVASIGSRAFANCTALKAVYLPSGAVTIASDAFDGSTNVVLYVKDQSPAYVFAVANGFEYELVGDAVSFISRATELTAASGKPAGSLNNDQFALKRLLVRMESSSTRLPPIAQFNPTDIVSDGDGLYVLQFSTPDEANRCNAYLESASGVLYVSEDRYLHSDMSSAELNAASLSNAWNDGDPMGFNEYAAYVYAAYVDENYNDTVTVAVIDSGVGYNAALDGRVRSDGFDCLTRTSGARYDPIGHGTQIAALILELVGENNVQILPIRAFDADGHPTILSLTTAIKYARQKGASIINLSSSFEYDGSIANEIRMCSATVIVAAGNKNMDCATVFPANMSGVVTVGGVAPNASGGIVRWKVNDDVGSNYGSCVDYAAPAAGVIAGSGYSETYGTSFAAPHIAAAYALLALDQEHGVADMRATCKEIPNAQLGAGMPVLSDLAAEYVTSITLGNPPAAIMSKGQYYAGLLQVTPADATNTALTVFSSDNSVMNASITADGILVLTALKPGTADITITASDGGGAQLKLSITVVQQVTQIVLSYEGDNTLYLDSTRQLYTQVLPTTAAQKGIEWSISPKGAATVVDGLVTPKIEGKVTITATASDGFGATASVTFDVVDRPAPDSVEIIGGHQTINVGDSVQLSATVLPLEANQAIAWTSSDSGVAAIDENGVLTAKKAGITIVEAEAVNGKHDSIIVTVSQPPKSVTVSGASSLKVGQTAVMTATVLPADASDKTVTWSSSNTAVATVDAVTGTVTAISRGDVIITATCNADKTISGGCYITVLQPVIGIVISGTTTLTEGTPTKLTATVSPSNANDMSLTWTSSEKGVATVDSNGVVTAVAPGKTYITATANDGSGVVSNALLITVKYATFTVTFNANGGSCTTSSMTATRSTALGTLPTPTRDYHIFLGWYTAASGGTQVTASTSYPTATPVTVYARWTPKGESGWVLEDQVPPGAKITATSWSYRMHEESDAPSKDGWIANGSYLVQNGNPVSRKYAIFPDGFKTTHTLYTSLAHEPYQESETATTKCIVENTHAGYIYWHWIYGVTYSPIVKHGGYDRTIAWEQGDYSYYGGSGKMPFSKFYAFEHTTDCPSLGVKGPKRVQPSAQEVFDCYSIIKQVASKDDLGSDGPVGTDIFFRFETYTSTQTNYIKRFKYYRDFEYQTTDPGTGANITNKIKYVKYVEK